MSSRRGNRGRGSLLDILVEQLDAAEKATDPSGNAQGKDHDVFCAMLKVQKIIWELAAWGLHHIYGMSLEGHRMLPLQPGGVTKSGALTGTKGLVEYRLDRLSVDSHLHEQKGEREFHHPPALPSDRRLILRNLVFSGATGFPDWLREELVEALDTLDSGATPSLLAPERQSGMRRDLALARLRIVCFVKFRVRAYGLSVEMARDQISEQFGISADNLKKWEHRLPKSCLGKIEVHREFAFAKNFASHVEALRSAEMRGERIDSRQVADSAERRYGPAALQVAVDQLRALKASDG